MAEVQDDMELETVKITKTRNSSKGALELALNQDVLEEIFSNPEVRDRPVAIHSIVGGFRTGKSFMLNLLRRYLLFYQRNQEETWLVDENDFVEQNFKWKGGDDRETEGIWMTAKPIMLQSQKHGEVAVFLMDTQGVFDGSATAVSDSLLFALSLLISSYQMYNITGNINRDCLDHLRVFADFGKLMEGQEGSQFFYQSLMFLVRDSKSCKYGVIEGKNHLRKMLACDEFSAEYKSICASIKATFQNLECALFPDPGTKVMRMQAENSSCKIEDVDAEFLKTCADLSKHLFHEIVVKEVNGVPIKGKDMVNLAMLVSKKFKGRKLNPRLLCEVNAEGTMSKIMSDCEMTLREKVKSQTKLLETDELKDFQQDLTDATLKKFDEEPKLGDDHFIEDYRYSMKELCKHFCNIVKIQNDAKYAGLKCSWRISPLNKASQEGYENVMKETLKKFSDKGMYVEKKLFEKTHQNATTRAVELYGTSPAGGHEAVMWSEFDAQMRSRIIPQRKRFFEKENDSKKEEIRVELLWTRAKALRSYSECCKNAPSNKYQTVHDRALQEAKKLFDGLASKESSLWEEVWTETKTALEQRKTIYQAHIRLNEILQKSTAVAQDVVTDVRATYVNEMEKECKRQFMPEDRFLKCHLAASDKAMKKLHETFELNVVKPCEHLVLETVEKERNMLLERNKDLHAENYLTFIEKSLQLEKDYTSNLPKKSWYDWLTRVDQTNEKLQQKHKNLKAEAVANFSAECASKQPEKLYEEAREDLRKRLDERYRILEMQNEIEQDENQELADKVVENYLEKYDNEMDEVLQGKYSDDNDLKRLHKDFKASLVKLVKSAFPSKVGKEAANSLSLKLDRAELRWDKVNQIHKKCYNVKVRNMSSIIGTVIGTVIGTGLAVVEAVFLPGIGWVLAPFTVARGAALGAAAGHYVSVWWDTRFKNTKK